MKITSEQVSKRIAGIEDNFRELQKKYLIGFKTEPIEDKPDRYFKILKTIQMQRETKNVCISRYKL